MGGGAAARRLFADVFVGGAAVLLGRDNCVICRGGGFDWINEVNNVIRFGRGLVMELGTRRREERRSEHERSRHY